MKSTIISPLAQAGGATEPPEIPERDVTFTNGSVSIRTISFDESYITVESTYTGATITVKPGGLFVDSNGSANWTVALPFHVSGAEFAGGKGTEMEASVTFSAYKNTNNINLNVENVTGPIEIWVGTKR